MLQHLGQVFAGLVAGHGEVVQQPVAAVGRGGAGHFALVAGDEAEGVAHQRQYVGGRIIAAQKQVVAGQAAHGTPVDNAVTPFGIVAQISRGQMFYGMDYTLAERGFAVGLLHAYVEGSDDLAADHIPAGNEYAPRKLEVVDGETGYLFHYCKV